MYKTEKDPEALAPVRSQVAGEVQDDTALAHDAVFGEITEGGPNYRNVRILLRHLPSSTTNRT